MSTNLPPADPKPLSGQQHFCDGQIQQNFTLSDFWTWSFSGLLNNVTRGHLAEFIVARALGVAGVREVWAAYDLEIRNLKGGKVKIEVKSAAYLQEWEQDDKSQISFNVRKTRAINKQNGRYTGDLKRQADIYVFAHYKEPEKKDAVLTLNLSHWDFYVLPKTILDNEIGDGKSISLKTITSLTTNLIFSGLKAAVLKAAP